MTDQNSMYLFPVICTPIVAQNLNTTKCGSALYTLITYFLMLDFYLCYEFIAPIIDMQ